MAELVPIEIKYTASAQDKAKQANATLILCFLFFCFFLHADMELLVRTAAVLQTL